METSELQLFTYDNKQVRTFERNGHVWFVLKDVEAITNHKAIRNAKKILRPFEVDDAPINDIAGKKQLMTIITESGLYRLILNSRLPDARRFSDYVCCEILPQIRKTGSFNTNSHVISQLQTQELQRKALASQRTAINKQIRFIDLQIEETKRQLYEPLNKVIISDDISVKQIEYKQKSLFD